MKLEDKGETVVLAEEVADLDAAIAQRVAQEKVDERLAANIADSAASEQALATIGEVGGSELMVFSPNTFENAWKLAAHISNSGIVPTELQGSAGAVLSVMARGAVVGIHWSVAIQTFHMVHGRVGLPAAVMAGLCDSDPAFDFFEVLEADDEHAIVEAKKKRWDKPRTYEVTMEDAHKAGYLDGKHSKLWKTRPRTMLAHMASREAARLWNPARMAGLHDRDELQDLREVKDVTPRAAKNRVKPADVEAKTEEPTGKEKGVRPARRRERKGDLTDLERRVLVQITSEIGSLKAKGKLTSVTLSEGLEKRYGVAALVDLPTEQLPAVLEWVKAGAPIPEDVG